MVLIITILLALQKWLAKTLDDYRVLLKASKWHIISVIISICMMPLEILVTILVAIVYYIIDDVLELRKKN